MSTVISGAEGWKDIVDFGNTKLDWLRQFVPLKNGIPVDDTVARIISGLSVKGFQDCFQSWIHSEIDKASVKLLLHELFGYVSTNSINANTEVKKLESLMNNTDYSENMSRVANAINGYDFDEALVELKILTKNLNILILEKLTFEHTFKT
ncbi:MAG: hypothetical protein GQ546_07210 [Gammaproteobacteria bacterium]|nr:hypothetical protein [Gammaproteobacteria bacterium]